MSGRVEYLSWITRDMLQASPEARFVFGDNLQRVGMGGQAGSMRGEPNAIGFATKIVPGMADADFFSAASLLDLRQIAREFEPILRALTEGRTVYVPTDGLGTGLSELPKRAPALANLITAFFHACPGDVCPWEFV